MSITVVCLVLEGDGCAIGIFLTELVLKNHLARATFNSALNRHWSVDWIVSILDIRRNVALD